MSRDIANPPGLLTLCTPQPEVTADGRNTGAVPGGEQQPVACSAPLKARGAIRPADWLEGSGVFPEWTPATENHPSLRLLQPVFCSGPLTHESPPGCFPRQLPGQAPHAAAARQSLSNSLWATQHAPSAPCQPCRRPVFTAPCPMLCTRANFCPVEALSRLLACQKTNVGFEK